MTDALSKIIEEMREYGGLPSDITMTAGYKIHEWADRLEALHGETPTGAKPLYDLGGIVGNVWYDSADPESTIRLRKEE